MYFDQYGAPDAPVLLLLHGAAALNTFAGQYAPLSARWRLVVPHLPGAGRAAAEPYDPAAVIAGLIALVESIGAPVALAGHSVGGELALGLVCARPELFSRTAFLSAWVCPTERSIRLYTRMAGLTAPMLRCRAALRGGVRGPAVERARYAERHRGRSLQTVERDVGDDELWRAERPPCRSGLRHHPHTRRMTYLSILTPA